MIRVVSDAESKKKKLQRDLDKAKTVINSKAGGNKPAFANAPKVIRPMDSYGGAASFAEYSAMRKKQEQDEANQGAAELLAQRYRTPGSIGSKEYQEANARNIGYKRVGNKIVFVTPGMPLPNPTKENTVARAQAPGAAGFDPEEFLGGMRAFDEYTRQTTPKDTTTAFMQKYFGGLGIDALTEESIEAKWAELPESERTDFLWAAKDPLADVENIRKIQGDYDEYTRLTTPKDTTTAFMQKYFGGLGIDALTEESIEAKWAKLPESERTDFLRAAKDSLADVENIRKIQEGDYDALKNAEAPVYDDETQALLDRYFGGKMPTADQYSEVYDQVLNDPSVSDEDVRYLYERGAELIGNAMNQQEAEVREYSDTALNYYNAEKLLGADAKQYAGGTDAEYYERFDNTYGAKEAAEGPYLTYGDADGMSLQEAKKYSASPYIGKGQGYDLQRWSQATPEEREMYNKLLSNYGQEVADNYMKALEGQLNRRLAEAETQNAQQYATEHPILSNLRTFVTAPIRGAGVLERYLEEMQGQQPDEYDPRLNLIRESEAIRGQTAQNIQENIDGWAGDALAFAYQTGTSIGDNLANMALWGGLGNAATLISMGLTSAGSAYNSAIDRGATHEQANAAGMISGLAEAFFERFSLDNIITLAKGGGLKNALINVGKQMGIEGSEEFATAVANEITDRAVMGELSQFELNKQRFMNDGMTEAEAHMTAYAEAAKEIGLSMAAGALSGGVMGAGAQAISSYGKYAEKKAQEAEHNKQNAPAEEGVQEQRPQQPEQQEEPAQKTNQPAEEDQLPEDYAEAAKMWEPEPAEVEGESTEQENTSIESTQPEQALQQQPSEQKDEQEQGEKEKPSKAPEKEKKGASFKTPMQANEYDSEGISHALQIVGVNSVTDDGRVIVEAQNEKGETELISADSLEFEDPTTTMLLDYGPVRRMNAAAVRNYLESYVPELASEEGYGQAYSAVYQRGAAGVDYNDAVRGLESFLSPQAAFLAYAAGENAYNQKHDTVYNVGKIEGAAFPQSHSENTEAASGSKADGKTTPDEIISKGDQKSNSRGRLSKSYTSEAFNRLNLKGKRRALAQMEILAALASRTKRTIQVVDDIVTEDGKHANALYDPKTGVIKVALDADEGAYAYAAAHELVHALKNEHKGEWKAFRDFVLDALRESGEDVESLIKHQMDRLGYNRADALEEVICNTVPAILQDENNLFKLYKGNRTLFERVMNWVKGLLDDVKSVGQNLSKRSQSWKQMDALSKNREAMQRIYDRMMAVMEGKAEDLGADNNQKYSPKEGYTEEGVAVYSSNFPEGTTRKERQDRILHLVQSVWSKNPIRLTIVRDGKEQEILARFDPTVDTTGNVYSDATKLAYGNRKGTMSDQKVTEKLADDFPELISTSDFVSEKDETGGKNEAHEGVSVWDYFANHIGFINEKGGYAEYNVFVDVKEKETGNYVYSVAAEKIKGSERSKAPNLYSDPKTILASVNGVKPAIADTIIVDSAEKVKYSLRDTDENVQNALTAQQAAFQQIQGGHNITALEADRVAGTMLKAANSDYDQKQLAGEMSRIFHYIETAGEDVDWQQVDDEMTELSARVMARSRTIDLEHEQEMKPIREFLKDTPFMLTGAQKKSAEKISGSYNAYRKSLFGKTGMRNVSLLTLDSIWGELSNLDENLFPKDTAEEDMPRALMEAVDAMKTVYHNGSGMNVEESAQWLASVMTDAYFQLPAVQTAVKDARKFGDSIRALNKAWQTFKDTSWSGYQNALEAIKAARGKQQRTEQQERVAAMRKKYATWRESDNALRRERETKTKYRSRIERTTSTLLNWLDKPTDAKHIPSNVEGYVRNLLASLDFTGKNTRTASELSQRLNMLADALRSAQEGEDENRTVFLERDQQMIDEIKHLAEVIAGNQQVGRGVYDLNGLELKELSKWLDVVKHVITEANKMHGGNMNVDEAAQATISELSGKKDFQNKNPVLKKLYGVLGPDMMDSFTFFEQLGSTANYVFSELRKGFDKMVQMTRTAEEHTKSILKGLNMKELSGRKAPKLAFELAKGGTLELTKAQIMEIYVLSRREQAQGHLYGDGVIVGKGEDVKAKPLTPGDVKRMTDSLTDAEKKAAELMQRFLSRECAAWGNEASLTLLGYRKFGEEYYWPISTDANARNTTKLEDNYAADIGAIKNQGMTKQTIEGAKNAIVINDIFDTYTRHISNMSAYAAYAVPLSDFTRWMNSRGVKTEIQQKYGKKALQYMNEFLMAINGTSRQAPASGLVQGVKVLNRNAKAASVGLNARVVIQQPTSFARAGMYMSPKYLSKALGMKAPRIELVNKYCGIAQWKNWGFYETNIGPSLRTMIVGDQTAIENLREKGMWLAAKGDEWTMKRLWNACEAETQEIWPELKVGSEEYYRQVGQRMSEIVDRTQVVDSVFHRSQMMRSKNELNQMLTNFMSEPTKTYNMLMGAIAAYAENRKDKAARNRVARALVTFAASSVLTAAAAAIIDSLRDDDAEKEWVEKYLDALGENTMDNLNPLGMIPMVKDVLSLLEGYEASRLDQQSIQRIVWAAQEIEKYQAGTSKMNLYGVSYKTMQAVSSVLGIPVSNLMREGNAIYQTVTGVNPTKTAAAQKSSTITTMYKAMMEGKVKRVNELRTRLQKDAGMTPKEIDTAIAEELKGHEKVKEAYEAKAAGRIADANRARNALTAKGFSAETVDKAIARYEAGITPKETKEKDPNEQLNVKMYDTNDAANTIRMACGLAKGSSSIADAKAVISELIADSTAKDPEKTTKSNIQSALKADYIALIKAGKTAQAQALARTMQELLGTSQSTLDKWAKEARTK